MRYSNPYSYRGYKVYEAEKRGAAGTIIYSDPAEDGAVHGPVYPHGPWGPDSHIQWGAVLYDWLGQGEPFTFHWQQQPDGRWTEGPLRDKQLPSIPSMPLNARNAAEMLKHLRAQRRPPNGRAACRSSTGSGRVRSRSRWTCRTTSASARCAASSA